MNGSLLRVLISKNFFAKGIEVDATYKGSDLAGLNIVDARGTFTIVGIRLIGTDEVALEGANVIDGRLRIFFAQSILKIDGMEPVRFAASCGIDEAGEKIQEGKRRGRKPKNRAVEVEVSDEDDDDLFEEEAA